MSIIVCLNAVPPACQVFSQHASRQNFRNVHNIMHSNTFNGN